MLQVHLLPLQKPHKWFSWCN